MKNKIISWIIWIAVWWIIVFWYGKIFPQIQKNITWKNQNNVLNTSVTSEQLNRISNRTWLSIEEIKQKLDSWLTLKEINKLKNTNSGAINTGSINIETTESGVINSHKLKNIQ